MPPTSTFHPASAGARTPRRPRPGWRPRLSLRSFLIVTGLLGLLMGGYVAMLDTTEVWAADYRKLIRHHGQWEAYHRGMAAKATRAGDRQAAEQHLGQAEQRRQARLRYEFGLWQPWRSVPPHPEEAAARTLRTDRVARGDSPWEYAAPPAIEASD